MKNIKTLFVAALMLAIVPTAIAQTADEIVNSYFENTGGMDAWKSLNATKISATVNQGGMEIPVDIYSTKEGKLAIVANFQGMSMTFMAYDGETAWNTNQMTMAPEKMTQEQTDNMKLQANDFPSPFMDYKSKGYTVEYVGEETMEGTKTHKIKMVQEPMMINGVEEQAITYYYFESENNVPIATEVTVSGQTMKDTMSDYEEVEGLYFPFAMTMMGGMPLDIKSVEVNPEIDPSIFTFPAPAAAKE
ncbi:MAG: outer membrane lipoprotein-sorting protein [Planctomycetota bacterium]|jgi:outer membrane lipoprotein-sorting protein|uniref:outer membrane lipoprotein-sorting protein n=1 Tax=Patiriisocius sp. Uisw_047 TaxID=3230969 RepID=UPI0039E9A6DF